MAKSSRDDGARLKKDIRDALRLWFRSLPAHVVESKCVCASGVEYSPLEILNAVEKETELGKDFIAGLCVVHRRMRKKKPNASVITLLHISIVFAAEAGASG